ACDLLTVEMASTVLGVPAEVSDNGDHEVERGGARFSSCGYLPADESAGLKVVSLTVDAPIDESGIQWAEDQFSGISIIDPTAEPVEGYGYKAVWSPKTGQLVVMKRGVWLSFMVGASLD